MRLRPGHHDACGRPGSVGGEHGRARGIGIAIQSDRLVAHVLRDAGQGLARAAVVRRAVHLVVRDHHRNAHLAADAEALVQRLEHAIGLVAHVRAVQPAELAQRPAHLDHLLGRRSGRRLVVQAGRNADRAGRQSFARQLAHAADLRRAGRPLDVLERDHAQGRVPDQQGTVGRRGSAPELLHIRSEGRKAKPPSLLVQQVQRRCDRLSHAGGRRRQRDAAVAGHHRGHALAHFGRHVRPGQQQPVVVRVRVDEAGGDYFACSVDLDIRARLFQAAEPDDAPVARRRRRPPGAAHRCRRRWCRCGSAGRSAPLMRHLVSASLT